MTADVIQFPTRGIKYCPTCDHPTLTLAQLERHIAECPVRAERIARSRRLHPSNHTPDGAA